MGLSNDDQIAQKLEWRDEFSYNFINLFMNIVFGPL